MDESWWVRQANIEEKIIQFLSMEFILTYLRDLQYRGGIFPHHLMTGKPRRYPVSCPWYHSSVSVTRLQVLPELRDSLNLNRMVPSILAQI